MNITKMWFLVERPTPAEEAEILGSSNDEDYIKRVRDAMRSIATDQTYWVECVEYIHI